VTIIGGGVVGPGTVPPVRWWPAAGTVWKPSRPRSARRAAPALAVEADITDRTQAEDAVQQAAGRFGLASWSSR
jgi:hypothetical protein